MRIRLVNFRCYDDTTFDFGEEGLALLSGASGKGKCLGKDMEVLMYDCTIKKVQDIEVGDIIMGDDSSPRTVLSTCSGIDNMYKIIPKKGDPYTVNSQHILTLKTDKSRIEYRNDRKIWLIKYYHNGHQQTKHFKTKIDAKIFQDKLSDEPYDISVEEYLKLPPSSRRFNYTYHNGINLPEQYLDFEPYWLGLWLGDGTSYQPEITTIYQGKEDQNRLIIFLKKYNLINNKHIPLIYKKSSRAQRLSLLAGFIDSGGHIEYNTINIIQKSKLLAADITFLALSLGYMAIISTRQKLCTNSETPIHTNYYNISIYGEGLEDIPTILPRKKLISKPQSKRATVHSFDILNIGENQYFGFELDGNGRFLLSDCKVTHNSSVLMGIYFALYGSGTKVAAYGKTSCSVEFEFDGLKIVRTKRPNRLIVNETYEDASGQEIINKKFGDTFDVTGYISQNALNSFVLMSPIDKLGFLEKFAFRDVDLGKIKARCKAYITKQHDALLGITSQLDMARKILDEMNIPNEIKFPLKCKLNQRDISIKNEYTRFKNCNTLIKRVEKIKQNTQNELNDLRVFEATLQSRKEQYNEAVEKLEDLQVEIDDQIYEGDDQLEEYQNRLEKCLTRRELVILEEQLNSNISKLEEMKIKEKTELTDKLNDIKETLWKEYTKDEIHTNIADFKACLSDMDIIEQYRKEIKKCTIDMDKCEKHKTDLQTFTVELEEKQILLDKLVSQRELYSCPACLAKVRLMNDKLLLADDIDDIGTVADIETIKEKIKELKNNISILQRLIPTEEDKLERKQEAEKELDSILSSYEEIPNPHEVREDLEYLLQYQTNQVELEKKKKEIENNIIQENFSTSYKSFKVDIEKLQAEVSLLQEKIRDSLESLNEEELRNQIIEQKHTKSRLTELEKIRETTEKNRDKCKSILDRIRSDHNKKYGNIRDEEELNKIIQEQTNILEEQEKKRNSHENNIQLIEDWKKYQEELDNYHKWEVKVEDLETKEKKARSEYAAATELKDKIIQAESIAMINIIDSINTHARVYLDTFFSENPISVQLQPFKETKKSTKPSINITIEYKGMEADMNMLSGGELSRVILAYTLALAEMFNTPLILLDECTASLDQDLTNIVFDCIRENFNGKMTLIIAHQIVRGTFDKVIELK